jgi:hypothetical protein
MREIRAIAQPDFSLFGGDTRRYQPILKQGSVLTFCTFS